MLTDLLSSVAFYIIPILLGLLFTRKLFFAWVSGSLLVYLVAFIAYGFTKLLFTELSFTSLLRGVFIFVLGLEIILIIFKYRSFSFPDQLINLSTIKKHLPLLFLLIFSSIIYFSIWRSLTPYPLHINWDVYEHITVVNKITDGYYSILPSRMTDTFTFNSYSTLFHTLLAYPVILLKADVVGMYWWLEFWHYLLTILATYLLTRKIFSQEELALLAGLISALVFESSIVYSSLFLLPQTFTALLTLFFFINILNGEPINSFRVNFKDILSKYKYHFLSFILLLLLHFIVGALACILAVIWWVFSNKIISSKATNHLLLGSIIFIIITIIFNLVGSWDLTNREEAVHFNLSLMKKSSLFISWYSISFIFFFYVLYISIRKNVTLYQKLLIISIIGLSLVLAPFAYFLKFFVIIRYLINIIIALGVRNLSIGYVGYIRSSLYCLVAIAFFVNFYLNQLTFKEQFYFKGFYSHFSFAEVEASEWLKRNFNNNTILISDPGTQYILEALSGINSPGGAYMSEENRLKLRSINTTQDPKEIKDIILRLKDGLDVEKPVEKKLFIVGGRYFAWQKLPEDQQKSFYYNVWRPHRLLVVDQASLNFLTNNFKVLYQNDELTILDI